MIVLLVKQLLTAMFDDSVVPTTNEEITLAQTLIQIKAAKPKVFTRLLTTTTTNKNQVIKGWFCTEPRLSQIDKSRWKFQEIFFNDKDATRNRQRRLGSTLEDSEGKKKLEDSERTSKLQGGMVRTIKDFMDF
ncbi:hypothetical protein Tco_1213132 [Tanacetum coccineum]